MKTVTYMLFCLPMLVSLAWGGEPLSQKDTENLRAAIEVMRAASQAGEAPFGAVMAGPDGTILMTQYNTTFSSHDHTRHAESVLASRFSQAYYGKPDFVAECTLYSSMEPCPMCMFTITTAEIERVVYGLSADRLYEVCSQYISWPKSLLSSHQAAKYMGRSMVVEGPFMEDKVAVILEDALEKWAAEGRFSRKSGK